ncbi:MAG: MOSC domain-containing protein [Myxococcales bacterium]|nr:MOSC domain-containing protein [Myxococcales bacterium]
MRVRALWRYPVKSLAGESVSGVELDGRGVVGDRLFALRDEEGKLGSGKTTRRFSAMPGLLDLRTRVTEPGVAVRIDGRWVGVGDEAVHTALSAYVGRPVTVAREAEVSHFDRGAVHLVTTASLRWLSDRLQEVPVDVRRLRPNLVVDAEGSEQVERAWVGQRLQVGGVLLQVEAVTIRCVMTTMAQPALEANPAVLTAIGDTDDVGFGVYASVLEPGSVWLGDAVTVQAG